MLGGLNGPTIGKRGQVLFFAWRGSGRTRIEGGPGGCYEIEKDARKNLTLAIRMGLGEKSKVVPIQYLVYSMC